MELTKKNDFVEINYTGYSNGAVFDSNIPEDLKKINSEAKPVKTIIAIGQSMVVPGLDSALENKEVGKEFTIHLAAKQGFGERDRNLLKTIPLKVFTDKNINPRAGMVLALDNSLAKIVTVSGARIITDFNNPLAGKELDYKCTVVRILTDDTEKASAFLENILRVVPEFEVSGDNLIIKGPKALEFFATAFKDRAKELLGKEMKFELKEPSKEEKPKAK